VRAQGTIFPAGVRERKATTKADNPVRSTKVGFLSLSLSLFLKGVRISGQRAWGDNTLKEAVLKICRALITMRARQSAVKKDGLSSVLHTRERARRSRKIQHARRKGDGDRKAGGAFSEGQVR